MGSAYRSPADSAPVCTFSVTIRGVRIGWR